MKFERETLFFRFTVRTFNNSIPNNEVNLLKVTILNDLVPIHTLPRSVCTVTSWLCLFSAAILHSTSVSMEFKLMPFSMF